MKKSFKKIFSLGAITAVLIGCSQICYARNVADYSAKVPTVNDYETRSLTKTNSSDAINNCTSMGSGKLVSWVENSSGDNITSKVSYEKAGRRAMGYSNADTYVEDDVHLNISTSIGTWHSIDTSGSWSPDSK